MLGNMDLYQMGSNVRECRLRWVEVLGNMDINQLVKMLGNVDLNQLG